MLVLVPGRIEELDVTHKPIEGTRPHGIDELGIVDAYDGVVGPRGAAVAAALEEVHLALEAIVYPHEHVVLEHRPRRRIAIDAEVGLDVLNELERILAVPVALVHKREDRRALQLAHIEQLARALFHAAPVVEQHDGAIGGNQRAVGVFGKVLVSRGVQQIELVTEKLELQHGTGHRDAALLLELHPVGGRMTRGPTGLHRAGQVNGPTVQQQLFGERGLAGVGVRDDREGAPAGDLPLQTGVVDRSRFGRGEFGRAFGHSRKIATKAECRRLPERGATTRS